MKIKFKIQNSKFSLTTIKGNANLRSLLLLSCQREFHAKSEVLRDGGVAAAGEQGL